MPTINAKLGELYHMVRLTSILEVGTEARGAKARREKYHLQRRY